MTPRIALAGWFGADNLGDELILSALAGSLRAQGAEVVAVSVRPERTSSLHGVEAVGNRSPVRYRALVRALRDVDAMTLSGGVIQSETSPWNIPFHASRLRAAAAARKPVAGVGLGVGRVDAGVGRRLAVGSLRRAAALAVRDGASAQRLACWGLEGATVGADPVIGLRPDPAAPQDSMCVILRWPNRRGLATAAARSRFAARDDAWVAATARAVDAAASATGLAPRLIAFQASRDDPLHRAVADRLRTAAEVAAPTLRTVLTEVGRSRLVITMRYHGAVAALLHNRPAVLLDYSPKMASLSAEGRGWAPAVDPADISAGQLAAAARAALGNTERVSEARDTLRARLTHNNDALDALLAAAERAR